MTVILGERLAPIREEPRVAAAPAPPGPPEPVGPRSAGLLDLYAGRTGYRRPGAYRPRVTGQGAIAGKPVPLGRGTAAHHQALRARTRRSATASPHRRRQRAPQPHRRIVHARWMAAAPLLSFVGPRHRLTIATLAVVMIVAGVAGAGLA